MNKKNLLFGENLLKLYPSDTRSERFLIIKKAFFEGSTNKMAEELKIPNTSVSSWCGNNRRMSLQTIDLIHDGLPNLNINWFLYNCGPILTSEYPLFAKESNKTSEPQVSYVAEPEQTQQNCSGEILLDIIKQKDQQISQLLNIIQQMSSK